MQVVQDGDPSDEGHSPRNLHRPQAALPPIRPNDPHAGNNIGFLSPSLRQLAESLTSTTVGSNDKRKLATVGSRVDAFDVEYLLAEVNGRERGENVQGWRGRDREGVEKQLVESRLVEILG